MTTQPNDGGPAFSIPGMDGVMAPHPGMMLRDWIAGQALTGLLASPDPGPDLDSFQEISKELSNIAYAYADAMLAARAKFYSGASDE